MKKYFILYLLINGLILNSGNINAENDCISQSHFRHLAKVYIRKTLNLDSLTVDDCIVLTKISNTLGDSTDLMRDKTLQEFKNLYDSINIDICVRKLEANKIWRGFGMYSTKYQLEIGGFPTKKSKYRLCK